MSFIRIQNSIPNLQENLALLNRLVADGEAKRARAAELEQTLANSQSNVALAAENLLAGGDVGGEVDENALRAELSKVAYFIKAADLAISKLKTQIDAQMAVAAEEYAKSRMPEQLKRAHQTLDALLDLADISKQESTLRAQAEAEGCAGHHFKHFALVIRGSEMTGSFYTEALFLGALFKKYEAMGLPPTSDHRKRLAALADQG